MLVPQCQEKEVKCDPEEKTTGNAGVTQNVKKWGIFTTT
jgi:hypothetical protein